MELAILVFLKLLNPPVSDTKVAPESHISLEELPVKKQDNIDHELTVGMEWEDIDPPYR